jgi:plasmid stabilization system protein ParE
MLPYRLTERALQDLTRLREWYDRTDLTLGDRATDAIYDVITMTRQLPESFPQARAGVRAALCREFPYRVYFAVQAGRVDVLAVYHTSRDPERWDDPTRE